MALAKKLEGWRDGGKREARFLIGAADGHDDRQSSGSRPAAVVRPGDLAALAGPGDARRAIVPRHVDPCEPPLSSRRIDVRRLALLIAARSLLAAASAPVDAGGASRRHRRWRAPRPKPSADRQAAPARGRGRPGRRRGGQAAAERQAAAAAIAAAEARISAADAALQHGRSLVAARRERLARASAPLAALLAGIATMGRRPPLARPRRRLGRRIRPRARAARHHHAGDRPAQRRASAPSSPRAAGSSARRRRAAAKSARRGRASWQRQKTLRRAGARRARARRDPRRRGVGRGRRVPWRAARRPRSRGARRKTRRAAARMAARARRARPGAAAPVRPVGAGGAADFAYRLPVDCAADRRPWRRSVRAGVRSRGLTLAAPRGASVVVPAGGTILFAGPFRRHDGVVIIDHGGGWMTLIHRRPPATAARRAGPPRRAARPRAGPIRRRIVDERAASFGRSHRRFISIAVKSRQELAKYGREHHKDYPMNALPSCSRLSLWSAR